MVRLYADKAKPPQPFRFLKGFAGACGLLVVLVAVFGGQLRRGTVRTAHPLSTTANALPPQVSGEPFPSTPHLIMDKSAMRVWSSAPGPDIHVGDEVTFEVKPYAEGFFNCMAGPDVPWLGDESCQLFDTFNQCIGETVGDGDVDFWDWAPWEQLDGHVCPGEEE